MAVLPFQQDAWIGGFVHGQGHYGRSVANNLALRDNTARLPNVLGRDLENAALQDRLFRKYPGYTFRRCLLGWWVGMCVLADRLLGWHTLNTTLPERASSNMPGGV